MSSIRKERDAGVVKPGKTPPRGQASGAGGAVGMAWPVVVGAVSGMMAAWVAAGSTGLLVTPLRHAIVGLLLGTAIVAIRPSWRPLILVAIIAAVGIVLSLLTGGRPVVDSLGVAAVLAAMVVGTTGQRRRVLLLAAAATGALAVYRAACFTVPTAWWADEAIGYLAGRLGGLFGTPAPWVGGSLGGLDLLVLMGVFYAGWLHATPSPRRGRAIRAAAAILAAWVLYLITLSYAAQLAAALPERPVPESFDPGMYRPTDWNVLAELRGCLPWNLPLAAAALQAAVAVAMLRWTRVEAAKADAAGLPLRPGPDAQPGAEQRGGSASQQNLAADSDESPRRRGGLLAVAAVVVAAATAVAASFPTSRGSLSGKTVVAYGGAFYGDWIVPTHDALEPERCGSFGLLPSLVADLGGKWLACGELSKEDLDQAAVVLVIHPTDRWPEDRRKRLEEYVRGGGSLLVVAGPTVEEEAQAGAAGESGEAGSKETATSAHDLRPVNDLLAFSGMAFRHDVAMSPAESWLGAVSGSTHPAVFGLSDRTLGLCLRRGSTIETSWPGRPILVGRWGWSEPGTSSTWNNQAMPDAGEKWGDLILAAERPVGSGTVVTLGDYWPLTNLGVADGYELAGRLLSYLANRSSNPQAMWRQVLALLGYVVLLALVVRRAGPARLAATTLTLAGVLAAAMVCALQSGPVPSPGEGSTRAAAARPIAYVDASHLEIGNDRPWANDSMDGFLLTLARNGYLPLKLHRWDAKRLEQAKLLVAMAPSKQLSSREVRDTREFVERGGCLICMVGATEAAASRRLWGEFEFDVRPSPAPTGAKLAEAEPMGEFPDKFGRFSTYYLNAADYGAGNYMLRVWFFHGWPIGCASKNNDWQSLVRGFENQPMVLHRWIGKGSTRGNVVLIGDSRFALNFNHGYYDGQMIESARDNADFWRWMLSRVTGQQEWIPPDPARGAREGAANDSREVTR